MNRNADRIAEPADHTGHMVLRRICTYRFGKILLVEGVGPLSPEGLMFGMYAAGIILNLCVPPVGKWWLFAVLVVWLVIQFFCHWNFTLFGASEQKLKGYCGCFKDTLRLIPAIDTRLIPDLYHIVLHLLILINTVLAFAALLRPIAR